MTNRRWEWVSQFIEYQLEATKTLEVGQLRDNLLKVISWLKARSLFGRYITAMEVMTRIEKVFLDIGNLKLKAPSNHHLVRVGLNGPMHTELINRQFGLIRTLNPVHYGDSEKAVSYKPWEFYRGPNRELSRARIVVGCFSGSAVSSSSTLQRL